MGKCRINVFFLVFRWDATADIRGLFRDATDLHKSYQF